MSVLFWVPDDEMSPIQQKIIKFGTKNLISTEDNHRKLCGEITFPEDERINISNNNYVKQVYLLDYET